MPVQPLLKEFSRDLASRLFERLESAARHETPESPMGSPPSGPRLWGRFLKPATLSDLNEVVQVGTFGTCDALRAIQRIQTFCELYEGHGHPRPSVELETICQEAHGFLLETCIKLIAAINGGQRDVVSAARFATLLAVVLPHNRTREGSPTAASLNALRSVGVRWEDQPDTIGWRWFLDKSWQSFPARCAPTALLLDALISIEPQFREAKSEVHSDILSLIHSSANYLCTFFDHGHRATLEETVVCVSAFGAYARMGSHGVFESVRRRANEIRARQLVSLEKLLAAFSSPMGLTTLRLSSTDLPHAHDPQRERRLKDGGFDIFLHGPLVPVLLNSPNPAHRDLASVILERSLRDLRRALDEDEQISTHWMSAVVDSLPKTFEEVPQPDRRPHKKYTRDLTVPGNRAQFFVVSDTQFGRDSTSHRAPHHKENQSFLEVQPARFHQLVSNEIRHFSSAHETAIEWSGLLHLGDVVTSGNYEQQGELAIESLRSSAEVLGIPTRNIVISPGNHDIVRPGIVRDLRDRRRSHEESSAAELLSSIRRDEFDQILPDSGFTSFRDMYARLIEQRVSPSEGGVEIVSFAAPRVTVHFVSLWPVVRYRIPDDMKSPNDKEYGLDPKAKYEVQQFLETVRSEDVTILLTHVPPELLRSWPVPSDDPNDWIGAAAAEDMNKFMKWAQHAEPPRSIHLILSGHLHRNPGSGTFFGIRTYTAGTFHILSKLSPGSFAARLVIDEGAIRIDTTPRNDPVEQRPTIIAVGKQELRSTDYRKHVLATYDDEAQYFIQATNVAGKFADLERLRDRFAEMLCERFGTEVHVLDVGAGAGRDADFFLSRGLHVTSLEGAPKLAAALRNRRISVEQINILEQAALQQALQKKWFHGIWMCATLVHVPTPTDLPANAPLMSDAQLMAVLVEHLVPGGVLYLDNKLGYGAHLKERGNVYGKRWFRYRQPEDLDQIIQGAALRKIDGNWYNGTNGFDAWIWVLADLEPVHLNPDEVDSSASRK